jgi:RNA polymerase sigma-70 factor (ECF subfamily)
MKPPEQPNITQLIVRWTSGDKEAEDLLFAALYDNLHALAVRCMRTETPGRTMGATALVHEAYIRFRSAQNLIVADRQHLFALASQVMRRILVDKARARKARPHAAAGECSGVPEIVQTEPEAEEIIAVDRALEDLSRHSQRQAKLVELRYFAGYSLEECATLLNVSEKTVQRDWRVARVRLRIAIDGTSQSAN